jgi:adenylate cyclase
VGNTPMTRNRFVHERPVFVAALAVVVTAAMFGLSWTGWLEGPENFYSDLWHRLAGVRYQPQHVAIVALDEATLKQYSEPLVCWTPHFARAVEVLRRVGARIIGLDYFYQVSIADWLKTLDLPPDHSSLKYDEPLMKQLSLGKIILAAYRSSDGQSRSRIMLPIPAYWRALPGRKRDLGLINLFNDDDGVIRRYVPALSDDQGQAMLTFAKLLALRAQDLDVQAELAGLEQEADLPAWSADDPRADVLNRLPIIGFVGPPNTIPRLSMGRLLAEGAENDEAVKGLKDKIVIIAFEPDTSQDIHQTPYSLSFWLWPGNDMSGPEVHANIVETLITGIYPKPVPISLDSLYLAGVILTGAAIFYLLRPLGGLAAGVVLAVFAGVPAYLVFKNYWLLPTAQVQLGILLTYMGTLGMKLTGEERERARLRKIFSRYVDDEVVERLLASGKLPDLGGEVFQVTVLFADIRNFTTISEKLGPRQVVEMLNKYLGQACDCILAQGGTVDKFIGDAVMAVFGAPVSYPDHARRALQAALTMAEKAKELRTWMKQHYGGLDLPEFNIGIGLHTGEAIVGNIGSPKRLEFTAIGDTVNAASRLESLTKELGWGIVAGKSTIEAAPGVITGGKEIRQVKGRKEAIEVFEVTGLNEGTKNSDEG